MLLRVNAKGRAGGDNEEREGATGNQWCSSLRGDDVRRAVRAALKEDVGHGDVTTNAVVPGEARASAEMRAREPLVFCGAEFVRETFRQLSEETQVEFAAQDGQPVEAGAVLCRVQGRAGPVLTAERVALNFAQRLSAVSTQTSRFVKEVAGLQTRILDTRKTTPGWRHFEKYAVRCGGGTNHRFGLYDLVLIKDNHLAALRDAAPNAIATAVSRARKACPHLNIEVEVDNLEQLDHALAANADFVLLDNMSVEILREAVARCKGRVLTEASGGVNLRTVREIAATGVDFVSVGALTHSAGSVDIGLDFI